MADLSASAGEFVPGGANAGGLANGTEAKAFVPAASAAPFVPGGGGGNGGMSLAAPPFVPRAGGSMDGE